MSVKGGHLFSQSRYCQSQMKRIDKITENVKNKHQVIDESLLNRENVREAITQNAEYLKLVARNIIILNPKKFKFWPEDSILD